MILKTLFSNSPLVSSISRIRAQTRKTLVKSFRRNFRIIRNGISISCILANTHIHIILPKLLRFLLSLNFSLHHYHQHHRHFRTEHLWIKTNAQINKWTGNTGRGIMNNQWLLRKRPQICPVKCNKALIEVVAQSHVYNFNWIDCNHRTPGDIYIPLEDLGLYEFHGMFALIDAVLLRKFATPAQNDSKRCKISPIMTSSNKNKNWSPKNFCFEDLWGKFSNSDYKCPTKSSRFEN